MRALFLNATLKPSPAPSSTAELNAHVAQQLSAFGVDVEHVRLADLDIAFGVQSDAVRDGDAWPQVREKVLAADIVVFGSPTWLGQPSSVVKQALERMDALISETTADGTPVCFNKVAGVIVVGNEDGAHHVIAEIAQAAIDLGFTIPGQAWTYWNKGPGPGEEEYRTSEDREWTHSTGEAMAHVLFHTATALAQHPIPKPPNA
ncbi:MAG: NADPH-dependent reductase [Solirubrobacterales bacterium]|nr:NADPH-dependent reductase [Solirubrobacterales bacterium]